MLVGDTADKSRAPSARFAGAAPCQEAKANKTNKPGPKPKILSEDVLGEALRTGLTHDEIAVRFKCGVRTVRRRLAEIRAVHGVGWPIPRPKPEPPKPRYRDDGSEIAPAEVSRKVRRKVAALVDSDDDSVALNACKLWLSHGLDTDDAPKLQVPRENRLAELKSIIEGAREADPGTESGTEPLKN